MSETQGTVVNPPATAAPKPTQLIAKTPPAPAPVAASSIAAGVNAAVAQKSPVPRGIQAFNTHDLKNEISYFHGMLYGETDSRKTSTAATFGGPEKTLILLTRAKEQLIPLQNSGFHVAHITDGEALSWALQFPDKAAQAVGFPEWAEMLNSPEAEPVLMVDDFTEGSAMLVDDNSTTDEGKERKDGRQIYKAVNDNLREIMVSLKRRRMHTIFTALAKKYETPVANEEAIGPDMPSGARLIVTAELEHVLFMKKSTWKFLVRPMYLNYKKKDEHGKDQVYRREIFAKHKLPKEIALKQPPVLNISGEENMELREFWNKVKPPKK
jgi:hypothetical protein